MGRVSHAYTERVTISVTSASLSSIGFPRMLLAFCAAVTIAGISVLAEPVAGQSRDGQGGC